MATDVAAAGAPVAEDKEPETKRARREEGAPEGRGVVDLPEGRGADAPFKRVPKRKVAILLAYNGARYQGIQRNAGAFTVEDELAPALLTAHAISRQNSNDLTKLWWTRAGRTDKGVHALANVIGFMCHLGDDEAPAAVAERVNAALPPHIRVLGARRVTKGFDARWLCTERSYEYHMPLAALRAPGSKADAAGLSADELETVNATLRAFLGSHTFHNYTTGLKVGAPQAWRYITSAQLTEPYTSAGGEPFVCLKLRGKSFLLHQIRKMVAVLVARARGRLDAELFKRTLGPDLVSLPMAPAAGLLMHGCHYEQYDNKWGGQDGREALALTPAEDAARQAFFREHLLGAVASAPVTVAFFAWLERIDRFVFSVTQPRAKAPAAAAAPSANADGAAAGDDDDVTDVVAAGPSHPPATATSTDDDALAQGGASEQPCNEDAAVDE